MQGDGFLYNMVRIIAGTLVEVGRGHGCRSMSMRSWPPATAASPARPPCRTACTCCACTIAARRSDAGAALAASPHPAHNQRTFLTAPSEPVHRAEHRVPVGEQNAREGGCVAGTLHSPRLDRFAGLVRPDHQLRHLLAAAERVLRPQRIRDADPSGRISRVNCSRRSAISRLPRNRTGETASNAPTARGPSSPGSTAGSACGSSSRHCAGTPGATRQRPRRSATASGHSGCSDGKTTSPSPRRLARRARTPRIFSTPPMASKHSSFPRRARTTTYPLVRPRPSCQRRPSAPSRSLRW